MKLSKIETKYEENDYGFPLYDAEQMQEYAKAKVFEALGKYGVRDDEWSDHEVELAHKQMTKFIFEEDTKND